MVAVAATLFGLNGAVSKVALSSGLSSLRLTEARSARTFGHEHVRRRIWLALALSLAGLALMVQLWSGVTLDGLGVTFALIAAVVFAVYLLLAEREVQRREAIPLLAWGFFFAVVFWTIVQPWWTFPAAAAGRTVPLQGHLSSYHLPVWALVLWVIVLGSAFPFALIVGA